MEARLGGARAGAGRQLSGSVLPGQAMVCLFLILTNIEDTLIFFGIVVLNSFSLMGCVHFLKERKCPQLSLSVKTREETVR